MQKISPITRNLLLINVLCYLVQAVMRTRGIDLAEWLGLYFALDDNFYVFQLFTYMFLHGSFTHLFFNMFSLWMFGGLIERTLGAKRFLIYYMVCGIGAGICQELWQTADYFIEGMYARDVATSLMPMEQYLNMGITIGASGACYGVLLAFGMLYPNERIMLLLPPIPMKAKYFVAGYAAIELISAYASNDNIAHFAHLGGMLFGWFLLRWWRRRAHNQQTVGGWQRWDDRTKTHRTLWQRIKQWLGMPQTATPGNAHHTATRESDYEYNMRAKREEERNEARMDEILDKVRRSGYDSLTTDEKHELFRLSRK